MEKKIRYDGSSIGGRMRVRAGDKTQMRGVGVQGDAGELFSPKRDIFYLESWPSFMHYN